MEALVGDHELDDGRRRVGQQLPQRRLGDRRRRSPCRNGPRILLGHGCFERVDVGAALLQLLGQRAVGGVGSALDLAAKRGGAVAEVVLAAPLVSGHDVVERGTPAAEDVEQRAALGLVGGGETGEGLPRIDANRHQLAVDAKPARGEGALLAIVAEKPAALVLGDGHGGVDGPQGRVGMAEAALRFRGEGGMIEPHPRRDAGQLPAIETPYNASTLAMSSPVASARRPASAR